MDSRVSQETKVLLGKMRIIKKIISGMGSIPFSANFIRGKLKEELEDNKRRRLVRRSSTNVEAAERKQSLKKCRRELLLYHSTVAELKSEDGRWITDRTGVEEILQEILHEPVRVKRRCFRTLNSLRQVVSFPCDA